MDTGLGATNDWKALVDVLGDLLGNRVGVTEACRTIADLGRTLGEGDNDLFLPFVGFDRRLIHFPLVRFGNDGLLVCYDAKTKSAFDMRSFVVHGSWTQLGSSLNMRRGMRSNSALLTDA